MKTIYLSFILLFTLINQSNSIDIDTTLKTNSKSTLDELSSLKKDVQEIRRDQLNYLIEKNLLKETYSTNYQTINLVITLILGIFAILGYLGLRDINTIKEGYSTKLKELSSMQNELEKQYKDILLTKEKSEEKLSTILLQNDEQNKKIKVLELREKIGGLLDKNYYTNALEYIAIGLDLMPNDIELLRYKGRANFKLANYPDSINAYEKLLSIEKTDNVAILDLSELYLFTMDFRKYEEIVANNKSIFSSDDNIPKYSYMQSLYYYKHHNQNHLQGVINDYLKTIVNEDEKKIRTGWEFADVRVNTKNDQQDKLKDILYAFIDFLEGKISSKELKTKLL